MTPDDFQYAIGAVVFALWGHGSLVMPCGSEDAGRMQTTVGTVAFLLAIVFAVLIGK